MAERVSHDCLEIPERHVAVERDGIYPSETIDLADAVPHYATTPPIASQWASLSSNERRSQTIEETIPLEEQAIRLSPRDPGIGVWYSQIGRVHLLQSRTDEAILWLEKARSANSALSYVHVWLAAAYALKGESKRAAAPSSRKPAG
jgi:hypothetical protein